MDTNSKVLVAHNLSKSFGGIRALKGVSFEVAPGQIHCLVGENGSGKSTFVKIIAGVHAPDEGEIILNGHKYSRLTVRDSIQEGVQVIYQDLSIFPYMSVAENIAVNRLAFQNRRFVDWQAIQDIAQEQLDKIGVSMDLEETAGKLSVANKQLIAICRALSMDAKLLFMDEPTTALTKREIDRLLSIVLGLKEKETSVVFISHKLDEVMKVADQVAVLRDGEKVGDFPASEVNEEMLEYYMTGREVKHSRGVWDNKGGELVLEVRNLTRRGHYNDVSFELYEGDVLGIIGPMGAGRTELAMTLFGLNPQDSGEIIIEGKEYRPTSPDHGVEKGISLVPENRQTQGLFMNKSIVDNICSVKIEAFCRKLGLLNARLMFDTAQDVVKELRIITGSVLTEAKNLSGGNQQKVVIGKWVVGALPKILVLDSPTVGVDVGAKQEIYERIKYFASKGVGIIFISDEIPEVLLNCNKALVMRSGEIIARLNSDDIERDDARERIYKLMYEEAGEFRLKERVI